MPILKHAKKKLRQDIRKERIQDNVRVHYKQLIKKAKESPSKDTISAAFQAIDKAAKMNLMHDNKAARLKSALSKAMSGSPVHTPAPKKHLTKAAQAKANKTITKAPVAQATPEVKAPALAKGQQSSGVGRKKATPKKK